MTAVTALAVVVGTVAVTSAVGRSPVTVERVVDGDTLDVRRDGKTVRVRLLNVDTPESVDPNAPVECLGPESTEFLKDLLPPGTEVRLEYDTERTDRYHRELAGVFLGATLVNAEIAREGLGIPVLVGSNDRFLPAVEAAYTEAVEHSRGLHGTDVECTIPSQVDEMLTTAQAAPVEASGSALSDLQTHEAALSEALLAVTAAQSLLGSDDSLFSLRALDPAIRTALGRDVENAHRDLAGRHQAARSAVAAEQERLENERLEQERLAREEAERLEQERLEQERLEQERLEQERLEQEQEAREKAEREAAERARRNSAVPPSSSAGSSSGSGEEPAAPPSAPSEAPNATGEASAGSGSSGGTAERPANAAPCRAYGPGGTTFQYIDCSTREPIDGVIHPG